MSDTEKTTARAPSPSPRRHDDGSKPAGYRKSGDGKKSDQDTRDAKS